MKTKYTLYIPVLSYSKTGIPTTVGLEYFSTIEQMYKFTPKAIGYTELCFIDWTPKKIGGKKKGKKNG